MSTEYDEDAREGKILALRDAARAQTEGDYAGAAAHFRRAQELRDNGGSERPRPRRGRAPRGQGRAG